MFSDLLDAIDKYIFCFEYECDSKDDLRLKLYNDVLQNLQTTNFCCTPIVYFKQAILKDSKYNNAFIHFVNEHLPLKINAVFGYAKIDRIINYDYYIHKINYIHSVEFDDTVTLSPKDHFSLYFSSFSCKKIVFNPPIPYYYFFNYISIYKYVKSLHIFGYQTKEHIFPVYYHNRIDPLIKNSIAYITPYRISIFFDSDYLYPLKIKDINESLIKVLYERKIKF